MPPEFHFHLTTNQRNHRNTDCRLLLEMLRVHKKGSTAILVTVAYFGISVTANKYSGGFS